MAKNVVTINENESGRNTRFKDKATGKEMSRPEFVKEIKQGNYPDYHIRRINNTETPVSNPDGKEGNNLD